MNIAELRYWLLARNTPEAEAEQRRREIIRGENMRLIERTMTEEEFMDKVRSGEIFPGHRENLEARQQKREAIPIDLNQCWYCGRNPRVPCPDSPGIDCFCLKGGDWIQAGDCIHCGFPLKPSDVCRRCGESISDPADESPDFPGYCAINCDFAEWVDLWHHFSEEYIRTDEDEAWLKANPPSPGPTAKEKRRHRRFVREMMDAAIDQAEYAGGEPSVHSLEDGRTLTLWTEPSHSTLYQRVRRRIRRFIFKYCNW
jgi:hypothetical protein